MRIIACLILAVSLVPVASSAQDRGRPDGIRAGAFIINPSITVEESYNSNIFLEDSGVTDTFLTTIAPSLTIESNWNRHGLRLETGAEFGFFSHDSDDDYIDYNAGLSGVLDITRAMRISGGFGYFRDHDQRGSVDVPGNIAEPVEFDGFTGDILGEMAFGRFRFEAFANTQYLDYEDAPLIGGGVANEDDRDRFAAEAGVEIGYGVRRGYEVFIRGSYLVTDYDDAVDDAGIDRDSTGFRVLGGLKVDFTRLVEASVGVGYLASFYDDPALADASGVAVDAGILWSVTPITSIFLNASRDINETTLTGASGSTTTAAEIGVRHELWRNLTLGASGGFADIDFNGISRNDQIYSAGLGAEWKMTRRLTLAPSYDFRLRDSNAAGLDFTDHRVSLSLSYGF